MKMRALAVGLATAAMLAVPQIAEAAWATATGSVNMRACAGVGCAKITVIPRGARVWGAGRHGGWYRVHFAGRSGFSSSRYIAVGGHAHAHPRVHVPPVPLFWPVPVWHSHHGHHHGHHGSSFHFSFSFGN